MNTLSEPPSRRSFFALPHDFSRHPAPLRRRRSGSHSPGRTSPAFATSRTDQPVTQVAIVLHLGASSRLAV